METRVKSIFGAYATLLQVMIDNRVDKFAPVFFTNYFTWGIPKTELTYATAIGRSRIEAAASVVAHGAAAPLRSRAEIEKLSGEVAAIKVKRKLDEAEYRNYLTVQALNVSEEAKKMQIVKLIWDDLKYVGDSVAKRVDIMCAQALNLGRVLIDASTNPDGIVPGSIDLLVPSANKKVISGTNNNVFWLSANAATAKPITDIERIVKDAQAKGITFGKILIGDTKLWAVLRSEEVVDLIKGYALTPSGSIRVSVGVLNEYMKTQRLPIFEPVSIHASIEKNGKLENLVVWNDRFVSFIPDGTQGVIHNAVAIEEIAPVAAVSYAKAGKTLISKWSQTEPFGEFTRGELSAFPGLETADVIYILDTESRTTFGA